MQAILGLKCVSAIYNVVFVNKRIMLENSNTRYIIMVFENKNIHWKFGRFSIIDELVFKNYIGFGQNSAALSLLTNKTVLIIFKLLCFNIVECFLTQIIYA
jgi:hypothetical protein